MEFIGFLLIGFFIILKVINGIAGFIVFIDIATGRAHKREQEEAIEKTKKTLRTIKSTRALTEKEAKALSIFYNEPFKPLEPVYKLISNDGYAVYADRTKWGRNIGTRYSVRDIDFDFIEPLKSCLCKENTVEFILPFRERGAAVVSINNIFNILEYKNKEDILNWECKVEETNKGITLDEYRLMHEDKRKKSSVITAGLLISYLFVPFMLMKCVFLLSALWIFYRNLLPLPFHNVSIDDKKQIKITGRFRGTGGARHIGPYYIDFITLGNRSHHSIEASKEITVEGYLCEDSKNVLYAISLDGKHYDDPDFSLEKYTDDGSISNTLHQNKRFRYFFPYILIVLVTTLTVGNIRDNYDDVVAHINAESSRENFTVFNELANVELADNQWVTFSGMKSIPNLLKSNGYTLLPLGWQAHINRDEIERRLKLIEKIQYTKEVHPWVYAAVSGDLNINRGAFPFSWDKVLVKNDLLDKFDKESLVKDYDSDVFPDSYYFKVLYQAIEVNNFDHGGAISKASQPELFKYLQDKGTSNDTRDVLDIHNILKKFILEQNEYFMRIISMNIFEKKTLIRINSSKGPPTLFSDISLSDYFILHSGKDKERCNKNPCYYLEKELPVNNKMRTVIKALNDTQTIPVISGVVSRLVKNEWGYSRIIYISDKPDYSFPSTFLKALNVMHFISVLVFFLISFFASRIYRLD